MANSFQVNPWVVDTVMATPAAPNPVLVRNIIWTDQVAAGDQLIIQDSNGNVIIDIKASVANVVQTLGNFGWVSGIRVTTLTSGKVYIYVR